MTDLKLVKLMSGEWVVGEVVGAVLVSTDSLTLRAPLLIHLVQKGPQDFQAMLAPFNPTEPLGDVEIAQHAIAVRALEVPKGLYNEYIRQTTGIEVVSAVPNLELAK